jgi:L-lysine exporter family protein LysE/ArgO
VSPFLFGLLFGLATAFPIGVQSFVVMNQGLRVGYPKVLVGIATASLCDSLLIVLGAAGASALLVAAGVSLLNPHAVFETVGLLGGAIAIQAAEDRLGFAMGAISASWVWFFAVGFGASALRGWLTPPVRMWTQRGSGALMLVFGAFLALQLL